MDDRCKFFIPSLIFTVSRLTAITLPIKRAMCPIIKPMGVVDDAAALAGARAMTVHDPVQGRMVGQAIVECLRRDGGWCEKGPAQG